MPINSDSSLSSEEMRKVLLFLGKEARIAARQLSLTSTKDKNSFLLAAAAEIKRHSDSILEENRRDIRIAREADRPDAFIDRLQLDESRIQGLVDSVEAISSLEDPVGQEIGNWDRPNGLNISRVRVPIGVIGIIYESRPNVTSDAGALCVKSGNAAVLRGGSDSHHTSRAIVNCLTTALEACSLPRASIQLIPTTDRAAVGEMLKGLDGTIDVIIPRGGKGLVKRVQQEARIPVFAHLEGICHTYIDCSSDVGMACRIVVNAKMRRVGICGATETLLVDSNAQETHLKPLLEALFSSGCSVRGDETVQSIDGRVAPANENDWGTEYLDEIISVKIVDGVENAISHIGTYGSNHTDSIVASCKETAECFLNRVDSAVVMHNTSTQFSDGGEFGMGAEIGIATGKMHARGPVGVQQLTSFKYVVRGNGQIRPK